MTNERGWTAFKNLARREFAELVTVQPSDRPWQMPLAAALASGFPLVVAAYLDRMADGVIASVAGLLFLYLPATPLRHRMRTVTACAFGLAACYAAGLLSQLFPLGPIPVLTVTAILVSGLSRYYRLGPPGSLFFIMTAAIGAYAPGAISDVPFRLAIFVLGAVWALGIGFLYSLYILRERAPMPVPAIRFDFDFVCTDAVVIGLFVGLSLALAHAFHLDKPYWVPISCLAVIQGVSMRAAWNRQVHRILGTSLGLLLTWALVEVTTDRWAIAGAIVLLTFLIETAVVRHYGFAAIFITPLTILLAEAPTLGLGSTTMLIQARFLDTVVGAMIGFAGAACLHSPDIRQSFGALLRRCVGLPHHKP